MFNRILLILGFVLTVVQSNAQNFTLSGIVKDSQSGETIIGAKIVDSLKISNLAKSNEYGFYSITLPKGKYKISFLYFGYISKTVDVNLDKDVVLNIELAQKLKQLSEVKIQATKSTDNVNSAAMGIQKIDVSKISKLPVIFGEKDILKTLSLLPGVKSAGEGNSGFNVRGGSVDQNLILLDNAQVYNASHLLGFFSTFNSDALKDVTLYKGNNPANYGGRLASVLDVKMREGNEKQLAVTGGLGLISSRLSVEGPIQKDVSSFLISGRRTYGDLFLKLSEKYKNNQLYFYDLNSKVNYKINDRNRIFLSGYFGRDVLSFNNLFGIDWGNATGTVRLNSVVSKKIFSNTSMLYSNYNYKITLNSDNFDFNIKSQIQDINFHQEFQFYPSSNSSWKAGINTIYHTISPSRFKGGNDTISFDQFKEDRIGLETALYITNSRNINEKLNMEYGLRLSNYTVMGPSKYYIYSQELKTDSVTLTKGQFGKSYTMLEPRISGSYIINEVQSIKAAYSRNTQNLHLLTNSTTSTPTDQWYSNTYNIKPELSDQVSIGYFRNFDNNNYEFSIESYYKKMQNQIDYKDGADLNTTPDVESLLKYGIGKAYGIELNVKKNSGNFTGWVSYTLSRVQKKINGINNNDWYNARQDRTHDLSLVGMYQINSNWNISGVFVYYTGNAVTYPSGVYNVNGQNVLYYQNRNADRFPSYHRMDLGATYEKKTNKKYQSSWNFSVYNVYGRQNPYVIDFAANKVNPNKIDATQTSLFRWVPSITYNFKF